MTTNHCPSWDDVVVRVRGLSSRLLGRAQLAALAAAPSLDVLAGMFSQTAYGTVPDGDVKEAAAIERHTRRAAAERLRIIGVWSGDRSDALAPLFEDEDRRNLRAITRGIVASVPPAQRIAGLIPTPELPLAPLELLAEQQKLDTVGQLLTAWGNPYGPILASEARRTHPDLFLVQLALDREYAARALANVDGQPELREYVRLEIDASNVRSALAASAHALELEPETVFIDGGLLVSRVLYTDVASADVAAAHDALGRALAGTPLAAVVGAVEGNPDFALLLSLMLHLKREIRVRPLSFAVVIEYLLRLRAEIHDLARITRGIAMETPSRRIVSALVTP